MKKYIEKLFRWVMYFQKYMLTDEEEKTWLSIKQKVKEGYKEWSSMTHGDDHCGPWIKNITHGEKVLIDKIHKKYYGDDWVINDPIGVNQVYYVKYTEIKNKVI